MEFLNIFVQSPGNLIYFGLVSIITVTCFLMVLGPSVRHPEYARTQRYARAMAAVVGMWVLMLVGALVTLLLNVESPFVLILLERGVILIITALLGWSFLTADHDRWGRAANLALAVLVAGIVMAFTFSVVGLENGGNESLEASLNVTWTFVPLLLTAFTLVVTLIYFGMIVDAPLKLVFFLLIGVGYGLTAVSLIQGTTPDFAFGLVRLSFVSALGITLVIVYRVISSHLEAEAQWTAQFNVIQATSSTPQENPMPKENPKLSESTPIQPSAPIQAPRMSPIERESVQLLRALGMFLENATPSSIPLQVVRASLDVLHADVGALLRLSDANYADIMTVYDRPMQRTQTGASLNMDAQPTLVNAIERRAQRPLFVDRNHAELVDLYSRLDITEIGPAYFQPLIHDGEIVAMILVALPYTKRELSSQESETLKGLGVIAAGVLALSYKTNDAILMAEERAIQAVVQGISPNKLDDDDVLSARQEMQKNLKIAREQIVELSRQVMDLKLELDRERNRVAAALGDSEDGLSISQRIIAINSEQHGLREERDELAKRLQEAETALTGITTDDGDVMMKSIIQTIQRERDELLIERDRLQMQLEDLRKHDGMVVAESMESVLDRMNEEKARLESEREAYRRKLANMLAQLKTYGVEDGPSGLANLIGALYEERARLIAENKHAAHQRDVLIAERKQFEDRIAQENEREQRMQTLQTQLKHIAADREAITLQRDMLRKERDEINARLESVKQHRTRLWAQFSGLEAELKEAHAEQARLRLDVQKLADERSDTFHQMAQLLAENEALKMERDQLLSRIEGDRERVHSIGENGVGSLQAMVAEISGQRNALEQEANQLRLQLANLQNRLDAAQMHAKAMSTTDNGDIVKAAYTQETAQVLMSLVEELRTPMTSIVGYVDLLLEESVGILGEMQRRFLQRVSSNVTRLEVMLNDLIRLTELDTGLFSLSPERVNVEAVIEDMLTNASMQFREKGLNVLLSIEDDLPMPEADADAINQIVGQLLTNAYLVSPPNSEITVSASRRNVILSNENGTPVDCLFLSISDQGGGIMPEDEARVFARKYKAENPLIQGLGDTGVGLSIAKVLIESHGGRLWLESEPNIGTTFNFVLPLNAQPVAGD